MDNTQSGASTSAQLSTTANSYVSALISWTILQVRASAPCLKSFFPFPSSLMSGKTAVDVCR